jgi:hypothetical protein
MDNPVASLLRAAGTTQADFANRFEFSKQAVVYLLAGTFTSIPPKMMDALNELAGEKGATPVTQEAYWDWQVASRAVAAEKLYNAKLPFRAGKHSPAHNFIVDTFGSRERFAKEMKLPPASLMRWERGITRGLPAALEDALLEVGYEHWQELDKAQRTWTHATR